MCPEEKSACLIDPMFGVIVMAGIAAGLLFGIYTVDGLISFPGGFSVSGVIIEAITGTAGTVAMLIAVFALMPVVAVTAGYGRKNLK